MILIESLFLKRRKRTKNSSSKPGNEPQKNTSCKGGDLWASSPEIYRDYN